MSDVENIYLATNETMQGLVKIGKTKKPVEERMRELSASTGVPGQFVCKFHRRVKNGRRVESGLHALFHSYRIDKEFFRIDWEKVKCALRQVDETAEEVKLPVSVSSGRAPGKLRSMIFYYVDAESSSEEEFKQAFLKKRRAFLRIYYQNAGTDDKEWNLRGFTEKSSVYNNLATGYLKGWENRGICKAEVSITPF